MTKKIGEMTITEFAAICTKYRYNSDLVHPCGKCPVGGYLCSRIFGVRCPKDLRDEFHDQKSFLDESIDISEELIY